MKKILKISLILISLNASTLYAQTTDALKITESGNVGINITNPSEKLEVIGTVKATTVTATDNANATTVNATTVNANNVNASGKIQEKGNDLLPKGTIVMWYGSTTAPAGWAICDGTIVNGFTTPNLSGRFIVGVDNNLVNSKPKYKLGDPGGAETVTLTEKQMPKHSHSVTYATKDLQVMSFDTYQVRVRNDKDGNTVYDRGGDTAVYLLKDNISIDSTGGSDSFDNRPPYFALYYIIKL